MAKLRALAGGFALTLLTGALALPAMAQHVQVAQSAQEIIDQLLPSVEGGQQGTARGLRIESGAADDAVPEQEAAPPPSISFQIEFEFDSAELTPAAKQQLDELAEALSSTQLAPFTFQINGHTDAVGPESYNETLSSRRAESVKSYLMTQHGISAARLEARGLGERALLDAGNPDAAINRRVEIVNLGAASN